MYLPAGSKNIIIYAKLYAPVTSEVGSQRPSPRFSKKVSNDIMQRLILVFFMLIIGPLQAQIPVTDSPEEEKKIKQVVYDETYAYFSQNYDVISDLWVHSPEIYRVAMGTYWQFAEWRSWDTYDHWLLDRYYRGGEPPEPKFEHMNHIVHVTDQMAWTTFEQVRELPGTKVKVSTTSQETRTLLKVDGEWKLIGGTSIKKYTTPVRLDAEHILNIAGYNLLFNEEPEKALSVFLLNQELFPESANVYDSASDAYLFLDMEDKALENVRKTRELLPEDKYVSQWLRIQLYESTEKKLKQLQED